MTVRTALAFIAVIGLCAPGFAQDMSIEEPIEAPEAPPAEAPPRAPQAAPQPPLARPGGFGSGRDSTMGLGGKADATPPPDVSLTAPISTMRLPTTLDNDFAAPAFDPAGGRFASGAARRLPTPIDDDAIDQRIDKGLTDAGEPSLYPPDFAFGAFQRGYFLTAFELALERAKAGDAKGQTLLGVLLSRGLGVEEDQKAAADWFKLAGDNGDPEALYALGRMYLEGQGVKEDLARAADLFEAAARKNHAVAAREFAYMLLQGRGRPTHATLAAAYMRRAAGLGDMDAQYALAGLYAEGVGVVADATQAARWFAAAARNGQIAAQVEYGILLFNGRGVTKNEAQAARWFLAAARADNPAAQIRIARLLSEGRGIDKDPIEAARWFQIAKARGETDTVLEEWFGQLDEAGRKAAFAAADRWLGPARTTIQAAAARLPDASGAKAPPVDKAVQ